MLAQRQMRRRFRNSVLGGLSAIILACGGSAETSSHDSIADVLSETQDGSGDVSATTSFPDTFTYRQAMPDGLSFNLSLLYSDAAAQRQPDAAASDTEISPETKTEPEEERWVKVGNDHHQEWCPPETPIYLAGKCVALEEVVCTDSDDTKVFFKKSAFGDFFEETIALSDPSLGSGGTTTFSFSADPEIMESFPDVCKGSMILIESYCSDGLPRSKGIKCADYLPQSTCAFNSVKEAYCKPFDLCPDVEGNQNFYLYDTNEDGVADSCEPTDICLDLPGLQTSFPYDNDGDGLGESCAGVDICPFVEGIQTDFVYDTDGDGTADSCAPDFCPTLAGVQEEFPYDNDNDGLAESCILDLCPENLLVGIQTEYPYDLDGDGVKDSCVPVDKDFCSEPDPQIKYPNATLYSYEDNWHMGFCVEDNVNQILHVICSEDGTWHTDITTCALDMPCVKGACAQCHDSDGEGNMEVKGTVQILDLDGFLTTKKDFCSSTKENDFKVDYACNGNNWKSLYEPCPSDEICIEDIVNGQPLLTCVPSFLQTCIDSDGTKNFTEKGYVEGMDKKGEDYKFNDHCIATSSGDAIADYSCNDVLISQLFYSWCKLDEICVEESTMVDGLLKTTLQCIPTPYEPTCTDSDGGKNFPVKGKVEGIDNHGNQYVKSDYCFSYNSGNGFTDYNCLGTTSVISFNFCAEGEVCNIFSDPADPSAKTFACIPVCIDSDPSNEPTVAGTVFDFTSVPYPDICEGNLLYQYQCDPNTNEKIEAGITDCTVEYTACNQGKCK